MDSVHLVFSSCEFTQSSFYVGCTGKIGNGTATDPFGSMEDMSLVLLADSYDQIEVNLVGNELDCLFDEMDSPYFTTSISQLIIDGGGGASEEVLKRNGDLEWSLSSTGSQTGLPLPFSRNANVSVNMSSSSLQNPLNFLAAMTLHGEIQVKNINFDLSTENSDGSLGTCSPGDWNSLGLLSSFTNFSIESVSITGKSCSFPIFSSVTDTTDENLIHTVQVRDLFIYDLDISRTLMHFENVSSSSFQGVSFVRLTSLANSKLIKLGSKAFSGEMLARHEFQDFFLEQILPSSFQLNLIYIFQVDFSVLINFDRKYFTSKTKFLSFNFKCSNMTLSNSTAGITVFKIFGLLDSFECSAIQSIHLTSGKFSDSSVFEPEPPIILSEAATSSDSGASLCEMFREDNSFFFKLFAPPVSVKLSQVFFQNVYETSLFVVCSADFKADSNDIVINNLTLVDSFLTRQFLRLLVRGSSVNLAGTSFTFRNISLEDGRNYLSSDKESYPLVEVKHEDADEIDVSFQKLSLDQIVFGIYSTVFRINSIMQKKDMQKVLFDQVHVSNISYGTWNSSENIVLPLFLMEFDRFLSLFKAVDEKWVGNQCDPSPVER